MATAAASKSAAKTTLPAPAGVESPFWKSGDIAASRATITAGSRHTTRTESLTCAVFTARRRSNSPLPLDKGRRALEQPLERAARPMGDGERRGQESRPGRVELVRELAERRLRRYAAAKPERKASERLPHRPSRPRPGVLRRLHEGHARPHGDRQSPENRRHSCVGLATTQLGMAGGQSRRTDEQRRERKREHEPRVEENRRHGPSAYRRNDRGCGNAPRLEPRARSRRPQRCLVGELLPTGHPEQNPCCPAGTETPEQFQRAAQRVSHQALSRERRGRLTQPGHRARDDSGRPGRRYKKERLHLSTSSNSRTPVSMPRDTNAGSRTSSQEPSPSLY